jgi:hypothetical protein
LPGQHEQHGRCVDGIARRRRAAGGYSLVEVLVATSIAGFLTAALTSGLIFLMQTNSRLEQDQQLRRVLGNLAEDLEAAPYEPCEDFGSGDGAAVEGPRSADAVAARDRYAEHLVEVAAVLEPIADAPDGSPRFQPAVSWRPIDGITVEVVAVRFWEKVGFESVAVPPATVPGGPGRFAPACPLERTTGGALVQVAGQPVVTDDGTQQITLRARSGARSALIQVVKADRSDESPAAGP